MRESTEGAGFLLAVGRAYPAGGPHISFHHAVDRVSSAGEFHPHALSEPDVNLSIHPAPAVRRQATCSCPWAPPPCGVGPRATAGRLASLAPRPLQTLPRYYEPIRP